MNRCTVHSSKWQSYYEYQLCLSHHHATTIDYLANNVNNNASVDSHYSDREYRDYLEPSRGFRLSEPITSVMGGRQWSAVLSAWGLLVVTHKPPLANDHALVLTCFTVIVGDHMNPVFSATCLQVDNVTVTISFWHTKYTRIISSNTWARLEILIWFL